MRQKSLKQELALSCFLPVLLFLWPPQERVYPKEIRGYKVARAKVEIKRPRNQNKTEANAPGASENNDALIELGEPHVASLTPLGVTVEVPIKVAAVKQGGRVDFLAFEDMVVNGTPVTIEDYQHPFDLPQEHPINLPEPIRIHITLPRALLGAMDEWWRAKESWSVSGRVYVFGRFRKYLMKFKRVVPIELDFSIANPLKRKDETGERQTSGEKP